DLGALLHELTLASGGPLGGARGEEELHLGVGEDDGPDVAALEDDASPLAGLPLEREQRGPDARMGGDLAGGEAHGGGPDGGGDGLAVQEDADPAPASSRALRRTIRGRARGLSRRVRPRRGRARRRSVEADAST